MNRKWILVAMASLGIALLAVAAVTASSQMVNTPLFAVRMEQASSKMNFLPTIVNGFAYTTEKGYTLSHDVPGRFCGDAGLLGTDYSTCPETCPETCVETCHTCVPTCPYTCVPTCPVSCYGTCYITCGTCGTCQGYYTCDYTCWLSCEGNTCNTCDPKCPPPP
jgi:hypothetical protein